MQIFGNVKLMNKGKYGYLVQTRNFRNFTRFLQYEKVLEKVIIPDEKWMIILKNFKTNHKMNNNVWIEEKREITQYNGSVKEKIPNEIKEKIFLRFIPRFSHSWQCK